MNEVKSAKRCYACGAVLQSEHKEESGYVDSAILSLAQEGTPLFCYSCYNERKYSLSPKEASIGDDFLLMLNDAVKSRALILYIIDVFSFECSFIRQVNEKIKDLDIVVIANKKDLLPSSIDDEELKEYVAHRFRVASLPVTKDDVILSSLLDKDDVPRSKDINKLIEKKRKGKDVYLIGPKQGGKSFFISLFLKHYENKTGRNISTKEYHGTSLSLIEIPLTKTASIYDTPGTGIDNSLLSIKDGSLQKAIVLKKAPAKRLMVLYPGQAMALGGIARVDNLGDKKIKLALYCSVKVEAYRLRSVGKDEKFKKLIERKTGRDGKAYSKVSPTIESVQSIKDMDVFDFSFDEEKLRDIGIAGLGWFSFYSYSGLKLRLYVPKGIGVYGSRSKIGSM